MRKNIGRSLRIALVSFTAGLLALSLARHDWIEFVFRFDPDGGSGVIEWVTAGLPLAALLIFATMKRVNHTASWRGWNTVSVPSNALHRTVGTIKTELNSIFKKLTLTSRNKLMVLFGPPESF
jgi:hypothetical protein